MSTNRTDIALPLNSALTRLGRRIRNIDDQQDLGRARLSALSVLVFGGPRSLSELAREEMVTIVTMHHVVKGLIERRLVRKGRDRNDGRKAVIVASAQGRRFMEEAREARLTFYTERIDELSKADQKVVARFAELAFQWLE